MPENGFHLSKLMLAFLNNFGICIVRHYIIFGVDKVQSVLVKLEMYNSALVINRSGCTVLYRLRHIVNVDIIAEHLAGAFVFH